MAEAARRCRGRALSGAKRQAVAKRRCGWARNDLAIEYHDREWGVPVHDDRLLFEFLILEGAQAGLSWDTILAKREAYREAFHGFDPERVARYTKRDVTRLLGNDAVTPVGCALRHYCLRLAPVGRSGLHNGP